MQVRCPQCHNPIELLDDSPLSDIRCTSCDSSFSLVGQETISYDAKVKTIGHFELINQLGCGGFGTVWMARDTELDRTVAIKIPRRDQLDAEDTEKFFREARAAAQLNHPNIVSVHEVGREGATVYIVSEYVQGLTLADWLTGQRLTSREAAELAAKLADGVHHAHQAGVIHRDLKPSNIILDADGEPHITDFGLAKREAGEITMTIDGKVLGTPAYMSPEQAKGEAHHADQRSDLYSLGVILFVLLTGETPFRGNARMLLHQVMHEEAPSPRKLNSNIPWDLETICLKCLEKDPRRRYASAQELAEELRRFLRSEPIRARPITRASRMWRWCKRNPTGTTVAALLVFLAVVGPIVAVNQASLRTDAQRSQKRAEEEAERNRHLLYVSDMNLALRDWEAANVGHVVELLHRHRPVPGEEDLRGFEWYYLWQLCKRSLLAPTFGHKTGVFSGAFSPDGKTLACGTATGTVNLWDIEKRKVLFALQGHTNIVSSVAFSPDGSTLASGSSDGTVKLWDVDKGTHRTTLKGHATAVFSVGFSPDGNTLASGSFITEKGKGSGEVTLWDVATAKVNARLEEDSGPVFAVAFSPDGKTLAYATLDSTVKLWDVETQKLLHTFEGHASMVRRGNCVTFSPDGTTLASASQDYTVKLWDVATGEARKTLHGHSSSVLSVVFSPDGKTLATGGRNNTVKLWDVASGAQRDSLRGHGSAVWCVTFSPDGGTLASCSEDSTVKLWNLAMGKQLDTLVGHTEPVFSVAFFRDSKRLASGGGDKTVRLWDLATGEELGRFAHAGEVNCVALSPDGRTLASGSDPTTVRLWDVASGAQRDNLKGHASNVFRVAFSPDGKTLASASDDSTVKLWDLTTGGHVDTLTGHSGGVEAVAFSPDGTTLASASDDTTVKLWNTDTGEELETLEGHTSAVFSVAFSPDGKILASGSLDGTVKLWDIGTHKERTTLKGHGGQVCSVAFSPDGKTLASGVGNSTVKLWDVASGTEKVTLKGPVGRVLGLAFSPDGKTLAAVGERDETVKLWRAATSAEVKAAGW